MKQKKQKEEKIDKKKKDKEINKEDEKVAFDSEEAENDNEPYGEIIDLDSDYGRGELKKLNQSEEDGDKKVLSDDEASEDESLDKNLEIDSDKDTADESTYDEASYDTAQEKETYDEMAKKSLKIIGIASICVAVLGFLAMGALVYFLAIKPPYIKEKSDRDFDIMYVTTRTDAISISDVVLLSTPSDVNFDAIGDTVAEIDANAKEYPTEAASNTDATATDVGYEDATFSDAPSEDF